MRTFAADEMGWLLAALARAARHAPSSVELRRPAAIADLRGALEPLAEELRERSARNARRHRLERPA